jgi:hypothetical protein
VQLLSHAERKLTVTARPKKKVAFRHLSSAIFAPSFSPAAAALTPLLFLA